MAKGEKLNGDHKRIGRILGALLFAQVAIALPVFTGFGMMSSVISPDFLTEAASNAVTIRLALLLTFVLAGLTMAVALVALPVFRRCSERLFWLYFALAAAGLATAALESVVIREMLAMSINYSQAGMAEVYDAMAPAIRSKWSAAHLFNLASGHAKVLIFFLILYRCRLIPRLFAGAGVVTAVLSTAGTTAVLAGVQFSYFMIAPAALVQLAMTLWLIWKGFSAPVPSLEKSPSDAPTVA